MPKLIVCLGYHLASDNSVSSVLKNRLLDTMKLCRDNKNSTLLLMGFSPYGNLRKDKISEASAMKKYLEENFNRELGDTKVITEETTTSTVEQLCYLKEFIEKQKLNLSDLVIVSSEFFGDRVKLYVEYIFGTNRDIIFIESLIPPETADEFKKTEEQKLKEVITWLGKHKKGDDQAILKEQKDYQNKVVKGEIKQPWVS